MRCLLCHKEMGSDDLYDLLLSQDVLCHSCRRKWQRRDISFEVGGKKGYAPYVYEENFAHCLIQFKEVGDEALQDIFLWNLKEKLHRKYRGYTLCLMPSSLSKQERRGFSHLERMFACLQLHTIEPFEQIVDFNQKNMPAKYRKEMAYNIRWKGEYDIPKKILLCDDTITTGSTLQGALSCLKEKAEIQILCVSANAVYVKKVRKKGEK